MLSNALVIPGHEGSMEEIARDESWMPVVMQDGNDPWKENPKALTLPKELYIDAKSLWLRKLVFVFGSLYGLQRALVTHGLEAATSFILETVFGWSMSRVSLAVGMVYLVSLVIALVCYCCPHGIGEQEIMSRASWIALLASAFLIAFVSRAESVILLADGVLFTASFMAAGVAEGLSVTTAVPESPAFNVQSWYCLRACLQSISRFATPLIVRSSIEHSVAAYAIVQLSIAGVGVLNCYALSGVVRALASWSNTHSESPEEGS
eukprot:2864561-Amphidinium_carterae.1